MVMVLQKRLLGRRVPPQEDFDMRMESACSYLILLLRNHPDGATAEEHLRGTVAARENAVRLRARREQLRAIPWSLGWGIHLLLLLVVIIVIIGSLRLFLVCRSNLSERSGTLSNAGVGGERNAHARAPHSRTDPRTHPLARTDRVRPVRGGCRKFAGEHARVGSRAPV